MADFTVTVEVEFTAGVWTDISQYVRLAEGISIRRGRGDEQSEIQPGTMTLTLLNQDGRFTPGLATGAYYPNVRKGVPIRAKVTVGGVDYPRFRGHVNEWPVSWEGGDALTLVEVTCTDLFKRLGALAPMRSLLEEEMLYLQPDAYYTLGEETGATSGGDTSGHGEASMRTYQVAGAAGSVEFGAAEGPGTDALPAPQFTPFSATQGKGLRADLAAPAGGSCVIACWLSTTTAGRDFLQICNRYSGASGAAVVLNADSADGTLRVSAFNGDDLLAGDFGSILATNLADGNNHLVAVHIKADGGIFIRIDATTPVTGLSYGTIVRTDVYDRLVAGGFKDPGGAANLFSGVLSHVWFKRSATMPDWSYVWSAGSGATESTVNRFIRLVGLFGLTGTILGSSTMQISAQVAGGKTPAQVFRDAAAVEAGLVYAARGSAAVVFECRNHRYNKASSLTLTVDDVQGDLRWSDDDQPILNDCTNRRDDGADQRVTDQASIDAYGIYAGGSAQPWASDDDALAAAQWAVYKGADPPPRVTQVTVKASTVSAHTSVLGLDLSDVITLSGLPATAPAEEVGLHVEGYDEHIDDTMHTITFTTSPAAPSTVWLLGTAGYGELGVTTRLAL